MINAPLATYVVRREMVNKKNSKGLRFVNTKTIGDELAPLDS